MRRIGIRRGMFAGLGLLTTVGMAACSAHASPASAGPGNSQTASTVASPAATTQAASPPALAPSATPAASGGVQNLVASSAVRNELTTTFVAYWGLSPSELQGGGALSRTVYYAYDPADETYWALTMFAVAYGDPSNVQNDFVATDGNAMFREVGSGPWQYQPGTLPLICSELQFIPLAVLTAWSMPTTPAADSGITC